MVHISSPPTYSGPAIRRPVCLSRPELSTAIGGLWKGWLAETEPSESLTGFTVGVWCKVTSPCLVRVNLAQHASRISSKLDLEKVLVARWIFCGVTQFSENASTTQSALELEQAVYRRLEGWGLVHLACLSQYHCVRTPRGHWCIHWSVSVCGNIRKVA